MKLNDSQVIISGGLISIDRELKLGEEVVMVVHGSVIEEKKIDNQDGTYTVTYRVRGSVAEVRDVSGNVIGNDEELKE